MTRIEQLIFEQAERNPDAIAVECDGERLTYGQLKSDALLIGHGLQNLGLQPGGKVVIFQERSLETFPLVLGIWNAGGVVVPINPNTPVKLLEWMIQSSSPSIIVTEGTLKERTVNAVDSINSKSAPLILDDASSTSGTFPKTVPPPSLGDLADDAYIIFTSG